MSCWRSARGRQALRVPDACPVCGSHAVREVNPKTGKEERCAAAPAALICPAQAVEQLKHFVSRNAFDIEGLGEKQIEFFFTPRTGAAISTPADIFTLEEARARARPSWKNVEGLRRVSVAKLFGAIDDRRDIALHRFIYALGIRHVGETNARLLARAYREL